MGIYNCNIKSGFGELKMLTSFNFSKIVFPEGME